MNSVSDLFAWFKREAGAGNIFRSEFPEEKLSLSFRSLQYSDLTTIYEWVNLPYAKRFWQMDGAKEILLKSFQELLQSDHAHSFIGLSGSRPICQADLYLASTDEVGRCYPSGQGDIGMHLLMAPRRLRGERYLSKRVMQAVLGFLFSYCFVENIVAEPDAHNEKACVLLQRSGFTFLGNYAMSVKLAAVYILNKSQFTGTLSHHLFTPKSAPNE